MLVPAPIVVAPLSCANGSIVVSLPIVTVASMRVEARVDDRHPGEHVPLVDAPLRDGVRVGEVDPVVHAVREVGVLDLVGRDEPACLAHRRQDVGQVQLALGVVGVQAPERVDQRGRVERVDAGVDLADLELLRRRVARGLGLGDAQHGAVRVADHAPVGARLVELHRGHRGARTRRLVRLDEALDRVGGEQRDVAVDDDHR